jgi:hypothetical protein
MLLSFAQTRSLLEKYGLPLVETVVATDARQAVSAARKIGYPLVLKATGEGINHKTEKGLVFTSIWCEEQLEKNFRQLAIAAGGASGISYLLQRQLSGAELIVGGKRDPAFGPVLLFGTGGIYAELLDDVSTRVCPVGREDARQMLYATHAAKFIAGFRSRHMGEEPMVQILLKASRMMLENEWLLEFDFNPVIAGETGATIVDARIVSK